MWDFETDPDYQAELDWAALESHLLTHLDLPAGRLEVRQFTAGRANLTDLVDVDGFRIVVRRPPRGTLAPSANDIARESGGTAIVTGGTRGIGLAIAEALIGVGANVVVASRKPEACAAAATHLQGLGGQAIGVPTHLGDTDGIELPRQVHMVAL